MESTSPTSLVRLERRLPPPASSRGVIVLLFPPCRKDLFGTILRRLEEDHDTRKTGEMAGL
jgi:hypothetical protein